MQALIKKYRDYKDNIIWHIETNKPVGEEREMCLKRVDDYSEVVNDLEKYIAANTSESI